jgi:hypothetical protein
VKASELINRLDTEPLTDDYLDDISTSSLLSLLAATGHFGIDAHTRIARNSYVHTNGFYKVVLHRNPASDRALRLHVWPPEIFDNANIHDHKWRFISRVLYGGFLEERFQLVAGDDWDVFRYDRRGSSHRGLGLEVERLALIGSSGISTLGRLEHVAGSSYAMPLEMLHRTHATGRGAITLVVTDKPTTDPPVARVLAPHGKYPADLAPRSLTAREIGNLLADVRRCLARND